jgi:hypothetical protein
MTGTTGQLPPYSPAPPAPPQPARRRSNRRVWQMLALIGAAVLVLAVLVFVTRRPAGTRDESTGTGAPHTVSGEVRGRTAAQFEIASGAETVKIHAADLGGYLYRVDTPPAGKVTPTVTDSGDKVQLTLAGTAVAGQATVDIQLNARVVWQLRLAGGGLDQDIDFRTGRLSGIEFSAGAGKITVTVPKPDGTLPIRLAGGAGQFTVHAPGGVPAQIRLGTGGGAGEVTVDGSTRRSVEPGAIITPNGWAAAKSRYDIEATAGVAMLTVDRY